MVVMAAGETDPGDPTSPSSTAASVPSATVDRSRRSTFGPPPPTSGACRRSRPIGSNSRGPPTGPPPGHHPRLLQTLEPILRSPSTAPLVAATGPRNAQGLRRFHADSMRKRRPRPRRSVHHRSTNPTVAPPHPRNPFGTPGRQAMPGAAPLSTSNRIRAAHRRSAVHHPPAPARSGPSDGKGGRRGLPNSEWTRPETGSTRSTSPEPRGRRHDLDALRALGPGCWGTFAMSAPSRAAGFPRSIREATRSESAIGFRRSDRSERLAAARTIRRRGPFTSRHCR